MKLKKILPLLCVLLLLCSCGSADSSGKSEQASSKESDDSFEVVKVDADVAYFCYTLDELLERSDAVVIGEYVGESSTQKDGSRTGLTKAGFKVERVLAGSVTADEITVTRRYEFQNQGGVKTLVSESELSPACTGDRWIMFLIYNEEKDYYGITSDVNGRFPLPEDLDKPDGYGCINGVLEPLRFSRSLCEDVYEHFGLK